MATIIEVKGLTKNYGRQRGIQDIHCAIEEGEVFGFLGPNGAGKTTTIRTLMGLLKPNAGSATIAGLDCWKQSPQVKRLVGYLPGEFAFEPGLTGAQIIAYLGHLRGGVDQSYVKQLVERLELDPSKKFREYSRGNKQKVGLVQAFMHRPRLLILDEPTGGLDPLNQQEFYKLISEVHANGCTIFLSSHILPEVEHTCDRVGIIREGRLVTIDTVSHLKQLRHYEIELTFTENADPAWFTGLAGVQEETLSPQGHTLRLNVQGDLREVIQAAATHHAINIVTHEPGLEEIFLRFYEPERTPITTNA